MARFTLEVRARVGDRLELSDRAWRRHLEADNAGQAWCMAAESLQFEEPGGYRAVLLNKNGFPTGPWRDCARPMMVPAEAVQPFPPRKSTRSSGAGRRPG